MRTVPLSVMESQPDLYREVKEVFENAGIVCFPSQSGYKLAADLTSLKAITHMYQAKRRIKNAPSLVFVPDETWVTKVAYEVSEAAHTLMNAFWPGPLTLLFEANHSLHPKIRKSLIKAKGWLGVRLPDDDISANILRAFARPILVSSANLARKQGATSAQQVRKNFGRTVQLMIDAGDLKQITKSTLVNVTNRCPAVVRAGAIPEEAIHAALKVA